MKAIVSLSGGMDSATILGYAIDRGREVQAVGFTYGSKHNEFEQKAAKEIAAFYEVPYRLIDLTSVMENFKSDLLKSGGEIPEGHYEAKSMSRTVVPGRNIIFSSILAGVAWSEDAEEVFLGIHQGDHCLPASTLVMTPSGPSRIDELWEGGRIFSVDTKTGTMVIDKIKKIWRKGNPNKLLQIKTLKHSQPLKCTSEHKVYVIRTTGINASEFTREFIKIPAEEIVPGDFLVQPMRSDIQRESKTLKDAVFDILSRYDAFSIDEEGDLIRLINKKSRRGLVPMKFDALSIVELLAWYVCEGWHTPDERVPKGQSKFQVAFCQRKNKNGLETESIMRNLERVVDSPRFNISKGVDGQEFEDWTFNISGTLAALMKSFGAVAREKHIPRQIFDILVKDETLREVFLTVCMEADGHQEPLPARGNLFSFCSSSELFIQQMTTLCMLHGARVTISDVPDQEVQYLNLSFPGVRRRLVSFENHWMIPVTDVSEIDNLETVYDIEVENNHNFITSNGFLVSNSIYPDCRPKFYEAMANALLVGTDQRVRLQAPFLYYDKFDILTQGYKLRPAVPYVLTRTCYKQQEISCGRCGSCRERLSAFKRLGINDPIPYEYRNPDPDSLEN